MRINLILGLLTLILMASFATTSSFTELSSLGTAGLSASQPMPLSERLDPDLNENGEDQIFVRMADQLFTQADDFEAFCKSNANRSRTSLRKEVLSKLQHKSNQSWNHIRSLVENLVKRNEVRSVKRYWIVNGFACQASRKGVEAFAREKVVSYVYSQHDWAPLHAQPTQAISLEQQHSTYQRYFEEWLSEEDEDAFSLEGLEVSWNLSKITADQVWKEEGTTGKGTVVALIDSGLLPTPALTRARWRNKRETLNGLDDDGNGYIDDIFGYDFVKNTGFVLGDSEVAHGSACGGIIAGRPINKLKLQTSVAPRSRLMTLKGGGRLEALEYAATNGADVVSMSYMIRRNLNDFRGVHRLAHEHLTALGIVSVGGAGNFSRDPAGQQISLPKDIPCVITAGGALRNLSKFPMGSSGPCSWDKVRFYQDYPPDNPLGKPDVTGFPTGFLTWASSTRSGSSKRWKTASHEPGGADLVSGRSGNSFSGPHAAGVACLMLSANPDLNAWEVKDIMERTCKDIGPPGRDLDFGAGLLQALEAVRNARQH